jgi:hypothetical protein
VLKSQGFGGYESTTFKRKKCIKKQSDLVNLVLDEKVKMNEVVDTVEKIIIGHFHGCKMGDKLLKDWVRSQWEPST